jgi:hypothetical protein
VIRKRSCVVWRGVVGKVPVMVTRWLPTLLQVRFGERNKETHKPKGLKVRFVPTPLSPLLANIALNGTEEIVNRKIILRYFQGLLV